MSENTKIVPAALSNDGAIALVIMKSKFK